MNVLCPPIRGIFLDFSNFPIDSHNESIAAYLMTLTLATTLVMVGLLIAFRLSAEVNVSAWQHFTSHQYDYKEKIISLLKGLLNSTENQRK